MDFKNSKKKFFFFFISAIKKHRTRYGGAYNMARDYATKKIDLSNVDFIYLAVPLYIK